MPDIRRTIVAIGSHDLILDLLASRLSERPGNPTLASANVGSLGGLLAVRRGETHIAGSHLMDEDTGEYNVIIYRALHSRIEQVALVHLAARTQGLMTAPAQPARNILPLRPRQPGRPIRQPAARRRHPRPSRLQAPRTRHFRPNPYPATTARNTPTWP